MTTDQSITLQDPVLAQEFNYSDGDKTEECLLACLRSCKDVSSFSVELREHIRDWPSEYHFSAARHHLLRPFSFGPGMRILELGCGCGAITRYLGETGAEVIAVEGSERRAQIARERCRDQPNVTIHCSDIMDFKVDGAFDFVTLIGVLEYAPKYIDASDPVLACLEKAASFLSGHGDLLIAIENKLGLKYFNGLAEDHLGVLNYSIYDLYGTNTPVTFGRQELVARLQAAGFPAHAFFYPFPDYKLPKVVLAEEALSKSGFAVANLLALMASRDPTGCTHPVFHEQMVWRAVIANELLPDLANSFLVVASKDVSSLAKLDPAYLASAYTGDRLPRFATETTFRKADDDRIIVEKRLLFPEKRNDEPISFHHDRLLHHVDTVAEYIPGELYVVELQRRLARGEGIDSVADWARDWLSILRAEADENFSTLPGKRLDAIPQNFIRAVDGTLQHIDDEWGLTCAIPLSWVVVRGLVNAFGVSPTSAALAGLTLREAISRVAGSAGLLLDEADFQKASELEAELRLVICGQDKAKTLDDLLKSFSLSPRCALGAPTLPEWFSAENSQLSAEIARVKSTVSWQITKPLRFLAFLWRKLVHADRLS